MQFRKASNTKKTNKNSNEAIVNEKNTAATEVTAKPRASRSPRLKKEASSEAPSAKNHRKSALSAAIPASEGSLVAKTLPADTDAPKAMAAAAGFESVSFDAAVIDPVGVIAVAETGMGPQYSHEDVAKLAYFYWIARGYSHGHANEDWLRAEAELTGKS